MILDYSEVLTQTSSFGLGVETTNRELYFEKRGYCFYCKQDIKIQHNESFVDTTTLTDTAWHRSESVWLCQQCGWWEHSYHSQIESSDDQWFKNWEAKVNSAILKKFDIDSNQIPLRTLENYLSKNPDNIINIHHKKMEELVGSIFSEHYKCSAKVVGHSNDGGIDVILIISDKPIVVQVKRRKSLKTKESVAPIRELIGTTLLKDSKDCIFVTTGEIFTKNAIKTRNDALAKNLVNTFELYNRDEFIDVLKLNVSKIEPQYIKYIQLKKLLPTQTDLLIKK